MEEFIDSQSLVNSEKIVDETKRAVGLYGHVEEIQEVERRLDGLGGKSNILEGKTDFLKVKDYAGRKEEVDKVFKSATDEMDELLKFDAQTINDKVRIALERGKLENTDKQVTFIEKYSQIGVLDNLQLVTFERTMAQKCDAKDSTKHTRRRKAKREKVFEKQKEALSAAAEMSNKLFQNKKLGEYGQVDEDTNESTKKYASAKYEAQMNYIDAMMEADKYDYENNIKMARTRDGRRVIDMGNGTSDYFASLYKLTSDNRIYDAENVVAADGTQLRNYLSGEEAVRLDKKTQALLDRHNRLKDSLTNDAKKCVDRLPDLFIALDSGLEPKRSELREKVEALKDKGAATIIGLVQHIIADPYIMATFRKDLRELGTNNKAGAVIELPNENKCKELADSFLKELNKKIAPVNANGGNV